MLAQAEDCLQLQQINHDTRNYLSTSTAEQHHRSDTGSVQQWTNQNRREQVE
jgi:hypothetical protein